MGQPVVELKHISKRFAKVLANDDISMQIGKGEVVALLGENGAGKSTIMKILYGLYHETSGEIWVDGVQRRINSPKDAMDLGISMIQQHFSLVEAHTVTENIILGTVKGKIDYAKEEAEIQRLSDEYQFGVPAGALVRDLPVGIQQKVEILKALHRQTRILIMDEPTAVLMPQEIDTLMTFVRKFASEGNSVIFITHKMKEVMEVADRIIIMRNGKISGEVRKEETDTKELARLMIGHELEILSKENAADDSKAIRLQVKNVSVRPKNGVPILENLNFDIGKGEILGVAGVSGNGQQELCEMLCGALTPTEGSVLLDGEDITEKGVAKRIAAGIGYCASDRFRYGMVANMTLAENMMLKASFLKKWDRHGLINWGAVRRYTEEKIRQYQIKAPDASVTAGSLSGGNQQKVVVAREADMGEKLIIFDQPTRGLDLGAINNVQKVILEERAAGKSVLLVSTELSEVFELADRIAVMYQGRFMGIFRPSELTTEKIGMLMAGVTPEEIKRKETEA
ncbi:MAG: ABC transporter ATP-binding protein [Lachnospiraceae bacterium]|nr:ABC transporter ATP-binding protein [Lachnospiraceae bacterium]